MRKVEIQFIKKRNKNFKQLDILSKLAFELYNYVNDIMKKRYENNIPLLRMNNLAVKFRNRDNFYYRRLPSHVSANVLSYVYRNWKSFFKINKKYNNNKKAYIYNIGYKIKDLKENKNLGKPHSPKNLTRERFVLIFDSYESRIKDGFIHFNKYSNLQPIKTKVAGKNFKQVRFVPMFFTKNSKVPYKYKAEVIYKYKIKKVEVDYDKYIGIDFGSINLVTIVFNFEGVQPILIKSGILRNIKNYFNKKLQTAKEKEKNKLYFKYKCKEKTYLHNISKFIIDLCIKHKIGNIIMGRNKGWKKNIKIKHLQKFKVIPFHTLQKQIEYKAKCKNIKVIYTQEHYTSKCDALAREPIKKHKTYKGSRISRDTFKSSTESNINADVNGALNILRKIIGDENVNWDYKILVPKVILIKINGEIS